VVTEVEGSAFRTGEHAFTLDPDDPLPTAFSSAEGCAEVANG
jgi:proline racemase